ncbi:uncharacterized protein KY384_000574 [Bacidia gigantensis]|uniref:uncharacterized protein n=1 Tax=Bacidia gigantensis TaxID=2732470 RepID=UPI001D0490C5|nr:uncharacterized protein KY384_000574 [Bacidia gigantensis]KAG8525814.1 hypothetical protein KY384_000574 [Bacidia gigantensis]
MAANMDDTIQPSQMTRGEIDEFLMQQQQTIKHLTSRLDKEAEQRQINDKKSEEHIAYAEANNDTLKKALEEAHVLPKHQSDTVKAVQKKNTELQTALRTARNTSSSLERKLLSPFGHKESRSISCSHNQRSQANPTHASQTNTAMSENLAGLRTDLTEMEDKHFAEKEVLEAEVRRWKLLCRSLWMSFKSRMENAGLEAGAESIFQNPDLRKAAEELRIWTGLPPLGHSGNRVTHNAADDAPAKMSTGAKKRQRRKQTRAKGTALEDEAEAEAGEASKQPTFHTAEDLQENQLLTAVQPEEGTKTNSELDEIARIPTGENKGGTADNDGSSTNRQIFSEEGKAAADKPEVDAEVTDVGEGKGEEAKLLNEAHVQTAAIPSVGDGEAVPEVGKDVEKASSKEEKGGEATQKQKVKAETAVILKDESTQTTQMPEKEAKAERAKTGDDKAVQVPEASKEARLQQVESEPAKALAANFAFLKGRYWILAIVLYLILFICTAYIDHAAREERNIWLAANDTSRVAVHRVMRANQSGQSMGWLSHSSLQSSNLSTGMGRRYSMGYGATGYGATF